MRNLSLGILAEGPTDVDFFVPLLQRLSLTLIGRKGHRPVLVAEPHRLPGRPSRETFRDLITKRARSLDIVVVHTDANGSEDRAFAERIEPWFALVSDVFDDRRRSLVAVVPVRETEAWLLCDVDALNRVFGTTKERSFFELPSRVREVERITDPKLRLKRAHELALGARRARRLGQGYLYASLGDHVSFEELAKVPAFNRFAGAFESALQSLGFLPGSR